MSGSSLQSLFKNQETPRIMIDVFIDLRNLAVTLSLSLTDYQPRAYLKPVSNRLLDRIQSDNTSIFLAQTTDSALAWRHMRGLVYGNPTKRRNDHHHLQHP